MFSNIFLVSNVLLYLLPKKYKKIKNKHMFSGASLARNLLNSLNLKDVDIELFKKKNKSYFDFKNNVINLKSLNFSGSSIYDVVVALKLVGEAVLYKEKCFWVKLRLFLFLKLGFVLICFFVSVIFFVAILQKSKIAFLVIILLVLAAFVDLITFFAEFIIKQRAIELASLSNNILN